MLLVRVDLFGRFASIANRRTCDRIHARHLPLVNSSRASKAISSMQAAYPELKGLNVQKV
jgi:hypothetical protein